MSLLTVCFPPRPPLSLTLGHWYLTLLKVGPGLSPARDTPLSELLKCFEVAWWVPFRAFPSAILRPFSSDACPLLRDIWWRARVQRFPTSFVSLPQFSFGQVFWTAGQFDSSSYFPTRLWTDFVSSSARSTTWSFLTVWLPPFSGGAGRPRLSFFLRSVAWKSCSCFETYAFSARFRVEYQRFSKEVVSTQNAKLTF